MSEKTMPTPDVALKNFFENNEVFADVFNSYLFKENVINASELQPANTAYADTVKTAKGVEKIGKYRDNIRKSTLGAQFVILGIEDQNKIHYSMPIRNMLYDALGYGAECRSLGATQDTNNWTIDEFLSKLSKGTMLTPIVTVVFYTGENVWDGPRSLHDMLDMDERIKEYIPDYPIHIIDLGHDDIPFTNILLKELAYVLKGIYDKSLIHDSTEVLNSTLNLAAILTNTPQLYGKKEGGRTIVCKALNEMVETSKAEGRVEGAAELLIKNVNTVMKNLSQSLNEALKTLDITEEEYNNAQKLLKK